jgi:hypothetical protein
VADRLDPSLAQFEALLYSWGSLWGLPGFEQNITIRPSRCLTRSLGRCNPAAGTITLRAGLPMDQIPYILCHEAAHIAAYLLFGADRKPHGPEWASLVAGAGFTPSVRFPGGQIPDPNSLSTQTGRFRYAHQCLACRTIRWARRPVRGWRCAQCLALGLTGEMKLIDTQRQDAPR